MSNNINGALAALKESGDFDAAWYLSQYPDVKLLGMDPAEHFLWIGKRLGRRGRAAAIALDQVAVAQSGKLTDDSVYRYFMRQTDKLPADSKFPISNFMYYIWQSRLDLQAYDLTHHESRINYAIWFLIYAEAEYGLKAWAFPTLLLETFSVFDGIIGEKSRSLLDDLRSPGALVTAPLPKLEEGANLIGYARGEFGMGEHVRMVAECMDTTDWRFGVVNVPEGGVHTERDTRVEHWIRENSQFSTNIFHINADILPSLYFRFGPDFFRGKYNIGYWAWELAHCPPEFDTAINMMDEVWGISEFVTESFRQRCQIPVVNMPLAVELPAMQGVYTKEHFGVSSGDFLFLFTFDSASYLDRKNPIAAVRAFKHAFRNRDERVRLILKTMNVPTGSALWEELVRETEEDPRITIMTKKLLRDEVLGLCAVCDAFISLHRSEGFGRCMSEAMLWGKPVVATGYSGTTDFIRPDTACVVNYKLVPVAEGVYPFWKGQDWADPDFEHAAMHMRKLVDDQPFRQSIARAGCDFIRNNFNKHAIGARYAERLDKVRGRTAVPVLSPVVSAEQDEIAGSIDLPAVDAAAVAFGPNVSVEGWVVSKAGIVDIVVSQGGVVLGHAHQGILRPDIGSLFAEAPNAHHSGFCLQVDTSRMMPGRQTLDVTVKSRSGRMQHWRHEFTLGEPDAVYQAWLDANVRVYPSTSIALSIVITADENAPCEGATAIARTLESLMAQRCDSFEMIVPSELPSSDRVIAMARQAAATCGLHVRIVNGTWKDALREGRGEFVGLVDIGDTLDARAVEALIVNLERDPSIDFVYADEDRLIDGRRTDPRFKPAWSPLYFERSNYIGRPWFARSSLIASTFPSTEGTHAEGEAALLRDALRVSKAVCHIPMVLGTRAYRPPLAVSAGNEPDPVVWPRVSIIMPSKLAHREIVERCFRSLLEETDYPDLEVFVITSGSSEKEAAETWLKKWPFKRLHWGDGWYSWSAINNLGARHATGDYLLFMNDDMKALNPQWLKEMVRLAGRPEVGVVGALLEYPNGRIQHAGICTADYGSGAFHAYRFLDAAQEQISWVTACDREVSAVTGACLLTRRDSYDAVGGFDEELPIVCNDTDFCLKMWEKGLSCVSSSSAKLIHYEGISRAGLKESDDVIRFQSRWRRAITLGDPFFNPNLDPQKGDGSALKTARASLVGRTRPNKR